MFPAHSITTLSFSGSSETSLKNIQEVPFEFSLSQNYPNPFNPATTISYTISKDANVILNIYDVLGKKVRTLVNSQQKTGEYSIVWNAEDDYNNPVSSGLYFYRLSVETTSDETGEVSFHREMVLLR